MKTPIVHLRARSMLSLQEGMIPAKKLAEIAAGEDMPAIGLCDPNLLSSLEFSTACMAANVQPIIGHHFRAVTGDRAFGLAVIATNPKGLHNLRLLSSQAHANRVGKAAPWLQASGATDDFAGRTEGLIALLGGDDAEIPQALLAGRHKDAEDIMDRWLNRFGGRCVIDIPRQGTRVDMIEREIMDLAGAKGVPIVAGGDIFFKKADQKLYHEVLLCAADGKNFDDTTHRPSTAEYRFRSSEEMRALFSDIPQALANNVDIAKNCWAFPEKRKPMLPVPPGANPDGLAEKLREVARSGLERRLQQRRSALEGFSDEQIAAGGSPYDTQTTEDDYRKRLEYECDVIIKMGFPGYFLIVSDFIREAKRVDIPVGPGRGSGAGSLVAWALDITDLDPLRFGLLFERFLNPDRVSMPDFDIDFCETRRDEVIDYVRRTYDRVDATTGQVVERRVGGIATVQSAKTRAAIKSAGRALGFAPGDMDRIAKRIPNKAGKETTLAQALEADAQLKSDFERDPKLRLLRDTVFAFEGISQSIGKHAAGIVIANSTLEDTCALYFDGDREPLTGPDGKHVLGANGKPVLAPTMPAVAYTMKSAEDAGLVKFDFLGLKTLSVIDLTMSYLKADGVVLDWGAIPLDDKKTYALLAATDSLGVFQFESYGMRDALTRIRPDRIDDIVAIGALYRPGPMENIPTYGKRKNDPANNPISYVGELPDGTQPALPYQLLHPILAETQGIIVYQEQVMELAKKVAGYSLGEADLLRRAMGKKIKEEMDKQRDVFVTKAVALGTLDKIQAEALFNLIAKFADYGFNKSHAAAYGVISFRTAYLKAHYPVHFYAASMTYDAKSANAEFKIASFARDARKRGIAVLAPNVNLSQGTFTVERDGASKACALRWGFNGLKGLGVAAQEIVRLRGKKPFLNVADFAERTAEAISSSQLETLVGAGALDCLEPNRAYALDLAKAALKDRKKSKASTGQNSLFDPVVDQNFAHRTTGKTMTGSGEKTAPAHFSEMEIQAREAKAFGFYFSSHPIDKFEPMLRAYDGVSYSFADVFARLNEAAADEYKRNGLSKVLVACVCEDAIDRMSAVKKTRFGILKFSNATGAVESRCFQNYDAKRPLFISKKPLLVEFDVRWSGDSYELTVASRGGFPVDLNDVYAARGEPVTIELAADKKFGDFKRALSEHAVARGFRADRGGAGAVLVKTSDGTFPIEGYSVGTRAHPEKREAFLLFLAAIRSVVHVEDADGKPVSQNADRLKELLTKHKLLNTRAETGYAGYGATESGKPVRQTAPPGRPVPVRQAQPASSVTISAKPGSLFAKLAAAARTQPAARTPEAVETTAPVLSEPPAWHDEIPVAEEASTGL